MLTTTIKHTVKLKTSHAKLAHATVAALISDHLLLSFIVCFIIFIACFIVAVIAPLLCTVTVLLMFFSSGVFVGSFARYVRGASNSLASALTHLCQISLLLT